MNQLFDPTKIIFQQKYFERQVLGCCLFNQIYSMECFSWIITILIYPSVLLFGLPNAIEFHYDCWIFKNVSFKMRYNFIQVGLIYLFAYLVVLSSHCMLYLSILICIFIFFLYLLHWKHSLWRSKDWPVIFPFSFFIKMLHWAVLIQDPVYLNWNTC